MIVEPWIPPLKMERIMKLKSRSFIALLTSLILAVGMTAACGSDDDNGDNEGNGGNGNNGEIIGIGYTGCDGLPELDDMAEGPELDEEYLTDGSYEIIDIETAARIQNIEVIPGTLRISNDFIDSDEQLECLELPNLEVVEGGIRGRDQALGGGGTMPEEITFENLTTVGGDFTFANLGEGLERVYAPALTETNTETDPSASDTQGLYIVANESLAEVHLPNLEEVYHLALMRNPVLETFDVSSLNEVTSWVQIMENPNFSSCEAQDIADEVGTPPAVEVCENHDDGCDESCDA